MTDRPILFSSPMVLALLAGRKTQTRRVIKKQAALDAIAVFGPDFLTLAGNADLLTHTVGDRLWVREDFCFDYGLDDEPPRNFCECTPIRYLADGATTEPPHGWSPLETAGRRRASMHMPRRFSRITLEVTDVRVERLQRISAADAIAEGIEDVTREIASRDPSAQFWRRYRDGAWNGYVDCPTGSYASLWTEINGPGSWEANPWVAAYTFTVHLCNIDSLEA